MRSVGLYKSRASPSKSFVFIPFEWARICAQKFHGHFLNFHRRRLKVKVLEMRYFDWLLNKIKADVITETINWGHYYNESRAMQGTGSGVHKSLHARHPM